MKCFVLAVALFIAISSTSLSLEAETIGAGAPAYPSQQTDSPHGFINDRDFLLSIISERDRQYSQRFEAQERAVSNALIATEKAINLALTAAKEAVAKAEAASEKRFESINEFRAQLRDQTNTFIPRAEYITAHKQLADSVAALLASQVPRSEHETRWAAETVIVGNIQSKLDTISNRQYTNAGHSEGSNWLWGLLAGLIGLFLAAGLLLMMYIQRPKP